MRIAVFATPFRDVDLAQNVKGFIEALLWGGNTVILAQCTVDALRDYDIIIQHPQLHVNREPLVEHAEYIVSLGGDGTFLRAAHWCVGKEIPIVGVNLGHLGYLTAFNDMELADIPSILAAGDYDIERRSLLEVVVENVGDSGVTHKLCALNEVAVLKQDTASMISIPVSMNGKELGTYNADGLIVSTPTGSTAYNLSVGGPVLQPTAGVWVLSPIADHSLTMRPMVVSDSNVIEVTALGRTASFRVSLDGESFVLPMGTQVRISKAPFCCLMMCKKGSMFSSTLRSKLLWGR